MVFAAAQARILPCCRRIPPARKRPPALHSSASPAAPAGLCTPRRSHAGALRSEGSSPSALPAWAAHPSAAVTCTNALAVPAGQQVCCQAAQVPQKVPLTDGHSGAVLLLRTPAPSHLWTHACTEATVCAFIHSSNCTGALRQVKTMRMSHKLAVPRCLG